MIITLTPNPAIDITYRIAAVTLGESHRVVNVTERAGGKGINTAAVLTSMGLDCLALAPVGDATLDSFAADLDGRGIRHHLVTAPHPTRRSVALVDDAHEATLFNEAGASIPDAVWNEVIRQVERLGGSGGVLTVSGSLPVQTPADLVARITRAAHEAGLRVVLDVSGPALSNSLTFAPELVKPNRSEAAATLMALSPGDGGAGTGAGSGAESHTETGAAELARLLVTAGAKAAVVSDGSAGLALATRSVGLRAWLPQVLQGNPTGAGDALTAALAAGLDGQREDHLPDSRDDWSEVLRRGVAWSAAAVLQPVAGTIDPGDVARLLPTVEIEETLS